MEAVDADVDVSIYRGGSAMKLGSGTTVSYSYDKSTWTQWFNCDPNTKPYLALKATSSSLTIPKGSKLYLKGTLTNGTAYWEQYADYLNFRFSGGKVKAGGNIYALMNSNAHKHPFNGIDSRYNFAFLFQDCVNLIEAPIFGDFGTVDSSGNNTDYNSGRQLFYDTFKGCKNLHRLVILAYGWIWYEDVLGWPDSGSGVVIFNMGSQRGNLPDGWSVINGIYNIG